MESIIKEFIYKYNQDGDHSSWYGGGDSSGEGRNDGRGCGYGESDGQGHELCLGYGNGNNSMINSGDITGSGSYKHEMKYSNSCGIKSFNKYSLYDINGIGTIITCVKGNIAMGFILQNDFTLLPCYIVKKDGKFIHESK